MLTNIGHLKNGTVSIKNLNFKYVEEGIVYQENQLEFCWSHGYKVWQYIFA